MSGNGTGHGNLEALFPSGFHPFEPDQQPESIGELKRQLGILAVAQEYTRLSQRKPGDWWGLCPFHAESGPSFHVDEAKQVCWCFGCNQGGDVIELIGLAEGLDTGEAIRRLRELIDEGLPPVDLEALERSQRTAVAQRRRREALARRIWAETVPISSHPLPCRYLTEVRGLYGWRSDVLRWHLACPWGEAPGGVAGCIVAPVTSPEGVITGIWRIKVSLTRKVERKGLGTVSPGAVRLLPGQGSKLLIAEGIEDTLAGMMLTKWPGWAALSAGNMRAMVLPDRYRVVLILADNDENETGQEAAQDLADRLEDEGRKVTIAVPAAFKDVNDLVLGRPVNG